MSAIDRVRQAAAEKLQQVSVDAREQARTAAGQAQQAAATGARKAADAAVVTMKDPATRQKARHAVEGAGRSAGRTVKGAIDKLNPGMLANVVTKVTALQEQTTHALQRRGSHYRISTIQIGASCPPSVNFQNERLHELEPEAPAPVQTPEVFILHVLILDYSSPGDASE
jgi:hypothetical protein